MATKRSSVENDISNQDSKRVKMGKGGVDDKAEGYNPYLAHQYEDTGNQNGFRSPLDNFERHKTTAQQASKVEDSELNPWTGRAHSQRYFGILESRRNLPVQKQRQDFLDMYHSTQILVFVGETGSGKTTQIPQYVLYDELPHQTGKIVACTQPRRWQPCQLRSVWRTS